MKFSVISTLALVGAATAAPSAAAVDLPADMSPRAALNEAESMLSSSLTHHAMLFDQQD